MSAGVHAERPQQGCVHLYNVYIYTPSNEGGGYTYLGENATPLPPGVCG